MTTSMLLELQNKQVDYDKIMNYLVLHIRKTYENGRDIADVIERQEPFNFDSHACKHKISTIIVTLETLPKEALEVKCKNNQYKIKYEAELQLHLKQKVIITPIRGRHTQSCLGQCTTGIQHRIEAKAKFKTKIKGNPIRLLVTIKENSLSFNDKKKADIVIIDAMMNLI